MKTALVTGANGFIGQALCHQLHLLDVKIHAAIRSLTPDREVPHSKLFAVGDLSDTTDWQAALVGVDTVFHLAGTVHQPKNQDDSLYHSTITAATRRLVEDSIAAGVKRFVYISTTKVYGIETSEAPIKETDQCHPIDPYGTAKLAAEQTLRNLTVGTQLEWVIIRPALVYGPEVKGNFQQLIKLVERLPILPFGYANAPRSFIALENLVNFMIICANEPAANQQTFNITDGNNFSTAQICKLIAKGLQKQRWLIPFPIKLLSFFLYISGRRAHINKLLGQLCYDITHAQELINWKPIVSGDTAVTSLKLGRHR